MKILSVLPVGYKGCARKDNGINYKNNTNAMPYVSKVSFGNIASILPDNFGIVIEGKLFRGGLPTTLGHFQALKEKGVTHILDLHGGVCGGNSAEAKMARSFDIKYEYKDGSNLGLDIFNKDGELSKMAKSVKRKIVTNKVVYVHCEKGAHRTGIFIAYYQLRFLGTTLEKVIEHHVFHNGDSQATLEALAEILSPKKAS